MLTRKLNQFGRLLSVGRISSEISQPDSVAISSNWYGSTLNATGLSSSAIFNAKKTGENREFSKKLQLTILFNTRLWILSFLIRCSSTVTSQNQRSFPFLPLKHAVISETISGNLRIASYFWLHYSF